MKSDAVRQGMQQAPHRSLFNALGHTEEEMKKPLIGIVSSYNEIVPGHMNLDKIVEAVKLGVAMAGGVPVVFPAIAVCDGIAMGHIGMKYSLVTRDLIADSTECMAKAHQFDALVMVPNCDKNVPGLLMAAARVNVPTIFVSGGPMLAGHVKGCKTSLSSMFEAVGAYAAGKITEEDVREYEEKTCPTCGSCSGMYTANSMNCLTEAIGMGLSGNGTIPAVYSERIKLAKHAGMKIVELWQKNIRPRDIMTEKAFHNALTVDMALGCSTNTMLHLPAIAREAGVTLNVDIANAISAKTPNLCHLAPAGHTYMEDLNEAGGVYAVMNELNKKNLLYTDLITVTGKTVGENIAGRVNRNPEVIRPIDNPYSETGGIAVLKGNIAPDSGVVKRSAVVPEMMVHEGPARVFDCEEDAIAAIKGGKILPGVHGAAGEIGHRKVKEGETAVCGCGKKGCLEQYGSATGVVRLAKIALANSPNVDTPLRKCDPLHAKDVFDYAKTGDELSLSVVDEVGKMLGEAIAHITCVLDPDVVVIGGGVSKAGQILLDAVLKHYTPAAFHASRHSDFKLAVLGNDAGMYGAVRMILNS